MNAHTQRLERRVAPRRQGSRELDCCLLRAFRRPRIKPKGAETSRMRITKNIRKYKRKRKNQIGALHTYQPGRLWQTTCPLFLFFFSVCSTPLQLQRARDINHHDESRSRSVPIGDAFLPHRPLLPLPSRITQPIYCCCKTQLRCLGRPLNNETSSRRNGRRVSRRCTNAGLDSACPKKPGAGEARGCSAGRTCQVKFFVQKEKRVRVFRETHVCVAHVFFLTAPTALCTTAVVQGKVRWLTTLLHPLNYSSAPAALLSYCLAHRRATAVMSRRGCWWWLFSSDDVSACDVSIRQGLKIFRS